jgi:hypothetical protein
MLDDTYVSDVDQPKPRGILNLYIHPPCPPYPNQIITPHHTTRHTEGFASPTSWRRRTASRAAGSRSRPCPPISRSCIWRSWRGTTRHTRTLRRDTLSSLRSSTGALVAAVLQACSAFLGGGRGPCNCDRIGRGGGCVYPSAGGNARGTEMTAPPSHARPPRPPPSHPPASSQHNNRQEAGLLLREPLPTLPLGVGECGEEGRGARLCGRRRCEGCGSRGGSGSRRRGGG